MLSKTEVSTGRCASASAFFLLEAFCSPASSATAKLMRCGRDAIRSRRSSICCSPQAARSARSSSASRLPSALPLQLRSRDHLSVTALLALAADMERRMEPAPAVDRGQHLLWPCLIFWIHIAYQRRHHCRGPQLLRHAAREAEPRAIPGATLRTLTNGTIQHGTQILRHG